MKNPNGYGSIVKLTGKRRKPYLVRLACTYTSDGDKLTEKRPILGYYHTRAEALQALAEYNKSPYDIGNNATFADVYAQWIKTKKVSDGVRDDYDLAFGKCSEIHNKAIADLRLQHYQPIVDRYTDKSSTTVRYIASVIKNTVSYAVKCDIIPRNYAEFLTSECASAPGDKHKVFTENEIQALWASPADVYRDLTLTLLYTGFRVNELLQMPPDCIDLDKMTLTGGNKTKAGKNRIVPIHHRIAPIIARYPQGYNLAYNTYKEHIRTIYGHTAHDTRHTFISRLQTAGADHICIQRLVGHASNGVTDAVYTHKDIDELRRNIELLT